MYCTTHVTRINNINFDRLIKMNKSSSKNVMYHWRDNMQTPISICARFELSFCLTKILLFIVLRNSYRANFRVRHNNNYDDTNNNNINIVIVVVDVVLPVSVAAECTRHDTPAHLYNYAQSCKS